MTYPRAAILFVWISNGPFIAIAMSGPFEIRTIPIQYMKTFGIRMDSVFECSVFKPPLYTEMHATCHVATPAFLSVCFFLQLLILQSFATLTLTFPFPLFISSCLSLQPCHFFGTSNSFETQEGLLHRFWVRLSVLFIPLQAKQVGEFIEIRHEKILPTRIPSTLGCL